MASGEIARRAERSRQPGPVDPGQIDLLVAEGFYANRTDFIRSAIRAQIATPGGRRSTRPSPAGR